MKMPKKQEDRVEVSRAYLAFLEICTWILIVSYVTMMLLLQI